MRCARGHIGAGQGRGGRWWWAAFGFWAFGAHATELSYTLGYAGEHSSNVRRAPVLEEDEIINSLMVGLSYRDEGRSFQSQVATSAEYRDYRRDTYADEALLFLDGTAVWSPAPHFSWTIADSYRNVPISRNLPDNPENRDNTNVFATGPSFNWRLSPVDTLTTDIRYGRFDAEELEIDNDRYSGALRWMHQHSTLAQTSINYEYMDVDYEDDVENFDYKRQDFFYRGQFQRSRNQLTLDLGWTDIRREGLPAIDGSLLGLTWSRDVSSVRHLGVTLTSQYSDTAFDLAPSGIGAVSPSTVAGPRTAPEVLTGEVYYTKRADAFMSSTASPFPWTVVAFARDTDYEGVGTDAEEVGGLLELSYLRSATLSFGAYSHYTRTDYSTSERRDRDLVNGLRVGVRLGRSLQLALEAQQAERRSTEDAQSYTDDRLFLRLTYSVTRTWI